MSYYKSIKIAHVSRVFYVNAVISQSDTVRLLSKSVFSQVTHVCRKVVNCLRGFIKIK